MNKDILPRMAVFIMAIVHIVSSYAQSVLPISGEVLDGKNREPLIGVTVVEKGTKTVCNRYRWKVLYASACRYYP